MPRKTRRPGASPTVREVIENKLKRAHINTLIRDVHQDTDWLNNSNEENLNYGCSNKQGLRKANKSNANSININSKIVQSKFNVVISNLK